MKHLFLLFLLISINPIFAQSSNDEESVNYKEVGRVPEAPGCDVSKGSIEEHKLCFQQYVLDYVGEHYQYPDMARQLDVQGRIYVNFIIEKDASVSNVEVVRGLQEKSGKRKEAALLAEEAAIRIVKSFQFNSPAYLKGEPVRMSFTLPINLKLQRRGGSFWDLFKRRD